MIEIRKWIDALESWCIVFIECIVLIVFIVHTDCGMKAV